MKQDRKLMDTSVHILIDPESGEYYFSCPSCARNREIQKTIQGKYTNEVVRSPIIPYRHPTLHQGIEWIKKLSRKRNSLIPRFSGANFCPHIPLWVARRYPDVFNEKPIRQI